MSVETWGLLAKSQTDSEKIEEAINRLIAAHNADETAHLGSGQSLQSHKASEIIDHLIASVVADKIKDGEVSLKKLSSDYHLALIDFASIDFWVKSAGISNEVLSVILSTGATINTTRYMSGLSDAFAPVKWSKNMFFQCTVKLSAITDQIVYVVSGGTEYIGGYSNFGFKISNGILYALHSKFVDAVWTEYTTEITGITLTDVNIYRAEFVASENKIKYSINGVLKATHDSNIPTSPSDDSDEFMSYQIENTATADKKIYIADLLWCRQR